jgi:hypothetical protein
LAFGETGLAWRLAIAHLVIALIFRRGEEVASLGVAAPAFGKGAAPGWGIISTPLPLGFPGRVIVAKPGDPTRRRSTKCPRGMTEPARSLKANPEKVPAG